MTTFLMIPGLTCDGHVWQATDAALRAAGHRTDIADVTTQTSLPEMAHALLDRHAGRLVPLGHSMGGRVAMEMARIAPDRLDGLALLNTGMHPLAEGETAQREAAIALSRDMGMAELAQRWLPGMMAQGLPPDPQVMEGLRDMVLRMTPQIHARQIRALIARPDARRTLGAFTGPMLVMTGRQDHFSPVADHEEIARLCPQARLVIIEGAGHFAPVEQPEATARAIVDWAATLSVQD